MSNLVIYLFLSYLALAAEAELKKFGVLVDKIGDVLIDDKYEAGNFTDFPFLKVECKPREFASLASLTRSENTMMSKVVMALAAIVQELDYCTDEANSLYDVFLYYGEPLPDEDIEESEAMKNIATATALGGPAWLCDLDTNAFLVEMVWLAW